MNKYEMSRQRLVKYLLSEKSLAKDSGARGKAFEIECAMETSKKKGVAKVGRTDVFIRLNGKAVPAECKTNGGRVETLIYGSNKSEFVIYRLDTIIKHKASKAREAWKETRYIAPIIVPTDVFIDCLQDCNALKYIRHGGEIDGIGIQASSKKLYERLLRWPVRYERTREYFDSDFEGLTL